MGREYDEIAQKEENKCFAQPYEVRRAEEAVGPKLQELSC